MDFDELRGRLDSPEFDKRYEALLREPISSVLERVKRREQREILHRKIHRILVRATLAASLALAAFQLYVRESRELPSQTAAYILAMAVAFALQMVDKARDKYREPKVWLTLKEFPLDEHHRLGRNIYFTWWNMVLLSIGILCIPLYASAMLSAPLRIACYAGTAAAILALVKYEYRRISDLRYSRDSIETEPDDLNDMDDLRPE